MGASEGIGAASRSRQRRGGGAAGPQGPAAAVKSKTQIHAQSLLDLFSEGRLSPAYAMLDITEECAGRSLGRFHQ
jgi:hypothetical protein